jgi:ammonia channel protein AmtB
VLTWVVVASSIHFESLKLLRILRVDEGTEEVGMDSSHHRGETYNFEESKKDANGHI